MEGEFSGDATAVADGADAPAKAVLDGDLAGVADSTGPVLAGVVAEPGEVEERFETEGARAFTGLPFGDVVERETQAAEKTGQGVVVGRAGEAPAMEAVFANRLETAREEVGEVGVRAGGCAGADVDAHFDGVEAGAVHLARDVGVLGADLRVSPDDHEVAAERVVRHEVPRHGYGVEREYAGAGVGVGVRQAVEDGVDGTQFVFRAATRFVVEVDGKDGFAKGERELDHAVGGIPASGPENWNRLARLGMRRSGG